ncbi:MAG: DUF4350 domain-containing protein [Streptosporangiaceae bacterium]
MAVTSPPSASAVAGRRFRAGRGIVLFVLILVALAVVLAILRPTVKGGHLDPESAAANGARAVAEITRQHGTPVSVSRTAAGAVARTGPDTTLVIVGSDRLTRAGLDTLAAGARGALVLIEPTRVALTRLAPGIEPASAVTGPAQPGCTPASLAGEVDFGSATTYDAAGASGVQNCYPGGEDELPRMVQAALGAQRTVTVLGSGAPFTNENLARDGNAALAVNLLGAHGEVVWLLPDLPVAGSAGDRSFFDLVPDGVIFFFWQLVIAVFVIALWRMRRLGPVVTERLPVVVRSAETVEGRASLYRAARARDRAASALRDSARERLVPLLGLPRSAAADPARGPEIVTLVTSRSGLDQPTSSWALYGSDPVDDLELIRLTETIDDLERRVRGS